MKIFLAAAFRASNVYVEAKNDLKLKTNVKYLIILKGSSFSGFLGTEGQTYSYYVYRLDTRNEDTSNCKYLAHLHSRWCEEHGGVFSKQIVAFLKADLMKP
jgi:hypothetical protein